MREGRTDSRAEIRQVMTYFVYTNLFTYSSMTVILEFYSLSYTPKYVHLPASSDTPGNAFFHDTHCDLVCPPHCQIH